MHPSHRFRIDFWKNRPTDILCTKISGYHFHPKLPFHFCSWCHICCWYCNKFPHDFRWWAGRSRVTSGTHSNTLFKWLVLNRFGGGDTIWFTLGRQWYGRGESGKFLLLYKMFSFSFSLNFVLSFILAIEQEKQEHSWFDFFSCEFVFYFFNTVVFSFLILLVVSLDKLHIFISLSETIKSLSDFQKTWVQNKRKFTVEQFEIC